MFDKRRYLLVFLPYLIVNLLWPIFLSQVAKRFHFIDYVFVVYFGTQEDIQGYVPLWFQRIFGRLFPFYVSIVGVILPGESGKRGIILTLPRSPSEYAPEQFRVLFQEKIPKRMAKIGAQLAALAGRLPSLLASHGLLGDPLTAGTYATVFGITETLDEALKKNVLEKENVVVGILGAAGSTGANVQRRLGTTLEYPRVIGIDPKVTREIKIGGDDRYRILTGNFARLRECHVVIVLTEEGRQLKDALEYLRPDVIVIDDTHPEVPEDMEATIIQKGGRFYKVGLWFPGVCIFPLLPGFPKWVIPACSAQVLVMLMTGQKEFTSQSQFDDLARSCKCKPSMH